MAKGIKRSITERKAEFQTQLDQVRKKIKDEETKAERLENQIKQLEVEEQSEILSKLRQAANEEGTTIEELLKPILDKQKKSV